MVGLVRTGWCKLERRPLAAGLVLSSPTQRNFGAAPDLEGKPGSIDMMPTEADGDFRSHRVGEVLPSTIERTDRACPWFPMPSPLNRGSQTYR